MKNTSTLIGFVRKSKAGGALNISVDVAVIKKARTYQTADGRKFVRGVANLERIQEIIAGDREVTSLNQINDPEQPTK